MIETHGLRKAKSEGAERLDAMRSIAKVETGFSNRKIGLVVTSVLGVVAYFSSFWGRAQVAWEEEGPPEEPVQPTTVAAPFEGRISRQDAWDDALPAPRAAEDHQPVAQQVSAQVQGLGGVGYGSSLLAKADIAMPKAGMIGDAPPATQLHQPAPGRDHGTPDMSEATASSGPAKSAGDSDETSGEGAAEAPSPGSEDTGPIDTTPPADQPAAPLSAPDTALWGTTADDILIGSMRDEAIKSLAGHDIIDGQAGNDAIEGGAGDDMIMGGDGHDILFGNSGNDRLAGGDGDDILDGGAGNDSLFDGTGRDVVLAGSGDDRLVVAADDAEDVFHGDEGFDVLILNQADHTSVLDIAAGTVTLDDGPQNHFDGIEAFALGGAQDSILLSDALIGQGATQSPLRIENFGEDDLFILSEEVALGYDDIFGPDPAPSAAPDAQPFYKITQYRPGDTVEIADTLRTALDGSDAAVPPAPQQTLSELETRIAQASGETVQTMPSHLRHDRPLWTDEDQRVVAFDLDQDGMMDVVFVLSPRAPQETQTDAVV